MVSDFRSGVVMRRWRKPSERIPISRADSNDLSIIPASPGAIIGHSGVRAITP
jgi:hypothetical protein